MYFHLMLHTPLYLRDKYCTTFNWLLFKLSFYSKRIKIKIQGLKKLLVWAVLTGNHAFVM